MQTAVIYNVTVKVDEAIAADWLNWLKSEHIPEILATGCFFRAITSRLLEVDDTDGPTFTIQYHSFSKAEYNRYIEQHAPAMRQKGFDAWGDRFIAFRSVMQVVDEM